MDNCSISQNPAKSWEVGRGCALGFCTTEEKKNNNNTCGLVHLNVKHLCKWLQISLAKQFQQIQAMGETWREKQGRALLTGGALRGVWLSVEPQCPRKPLLTKGSGCPSRVTGKWQVAGPLGRDLPRDALGHKWRCPNHTKIKRRPHLHFHEEGFPAMFMLVKRRIPVQMHICCLCI